MINTNREAIGEKYTNLENERTIYEKWLEKARIEHEKSEKHYKEAKEKYEEKQNRIDKEESYINDLFTNDEDD